MKKLVRIVVGVASLVVVVGWTLQIMSVKDWRAPMAGMGDNTGTHESGGEQIFDILFIGMLWLLPISPYLCMAAGAFNFIKGKLLHVAYVYSLVMLALITLIMLVTFQRRLVLIALGNIVIGSLWTYTFLQKEKSIGQ
jgi:hypothetical protein